MAYTILRGGRRLERARSGTIEGMPRDRPAATDEGGFLVLDAVRWRQPEPAASASTRCSPPYLPDPGDLRGQSCWHDS
jgi:hypothetical protein